MQQDQKINSDNPYLSAIQPPPEPQLNEPENYSSESFCLDDFISKKEFLKRFPELFQEAEFNWLIKIRKHNGFDHCVRKIGKRKLLFHVPSVLEWVNNQAA